jgi:RIO-like serine/threonine protein kinase
MHGTCNVADVKGGCLQGGNLGRSMRTPVSISTSSRYRGVQVLSFKELEEATDKFSEANVIGHGGFGVVYRGVLRDGTVAAIKRLHREGRQGERAFRLEVSDFIN